MTATTKLTLVRDFGPAGTWSVLETGNPEYPFEVVHQHVEGHPRVKAVCLTFAEAREAIMSNRDRMYDERGNPTY